MIRKSLLPAIFLLLLPFWQSCKKDPLTYPSKVIFDFELIAHEEEEGNLKSMTFQGPPASPPGRMQISDGTLAIELIEFDGRRDEGRDVFFSSNFSAPVVVDLASGLSDREMSFDIPQGIYNRMEFTVILGGTDTPPLILEGRIRRGHSEEIRVRFEYNFREQIRIRAQSAHHDKIVLREDMPSRAKLRIDAGSIFRFVSIPVLQNAEITVVEDQNVILINQDINNSIFNSMAGRIEKSLSIIFD